MMKYSIKVVTMISIILMANISCNPTAGKTGYSGSIEKAKELKVFVAEFLYNGKEIKADSLFYFTPKRIWLEKNWSQSNNRNKAITKEGYKLLLEVSSSQKVAFNKSFNTISGNYAILTDNGVGGGIIGYGEKEFFAVSYKEIPKTGEKIKIIKSRNSNEKGVISSKWKDPILVDEITLIKK